MSTPSVESTNAKSSLLDDIDIQAELNHEWPESVLANMDRLEGRDLAECILYATIQGRESLVRTLWGRRGPVDIVVDETEHGYRLNGSPINLNLDQFAAYAFSPKAIKSVLAMIDEFGMKGLVEPGTTFPALFKTIDSSQFMYARNDSQFEGVLPYLTEGFLRQPELAIALHDESSRVSTPSAYQSILCWASSKMVDQFRGELSPLVPFQEVGGTSMVDWKAKSGDPYNMNFYEIELGVSGSRGCTQAIHTLFSAMAPEVTKYGFTDEKGRQLCQTTTDFLLSFPTGPCTEENLNSSHAFVGNYCPTDIMALHAAEVCQREFGLESKTFNFRDGLKKRMTKSYNQLFEALDDSHPLSKRVRKLMTPVQWKGLLHKARSVSGESLLGLHQAFGIDNAGKSLELSFRDFEILSRGGFQFADNTQACESLGAYLQSSGSVSKVPQAVYLNFQPTSFLFPPEEAENHTLHSYLVEVYQNVQKTNLWPGSDKAPADIQEALAMAAPLTLGGDDDTLSLMLEGYLASAGLEACATVAKTPDEWITLTQVFSSDELAPYLKTMPSKARGRMLELGMGM
jgi:hypothetical protein